MRLAGLPILEYGIYKNMPVKPPFFIRIAIKVNKAISSLIWNG